jgi:hypothetical protein
MSGQSLSSNVQTTDGASELVAAMVAHSVSTSITKVDLIDVTSGGSYVAWEDAPVDLQFNTWWKVVDNTSGPLLVSAVAIINALATKPGIIFIDLGQSEGDAASGATALPPSTVISNMQTGYTNIFSTLRTACNAGSPTSVPIYFMPVGRRQTGFSQPGFERIRQLQLKLIANGTNIFGDMAEYDLAMPDTFHPEFNGEMAKYGLRVGQRIAAGTYGATDVLLGPSVTSVTMGTSARVDVAIAVETGDVLYKPDAPWGPRIEDSNFPEVEVPITGYAWAGNTLQLSIGKTIVGSPRFFTMYDYGANFATFNTTTAVSNYSNIIMGLNSKKPLRYVYNPGWA